MVGLENKKNKIIFGLQNPNSPPDSSEKARFDNSRLGKKYLPDYWYGCAIGPQITNKKKLEKYQDLAWELKKIRKM